MNVFQKIGKRLRKKPEPNNVPVYNTHDAVEFINDKIGMNMAEISRVLRAEEEYMITLGIIDQVSVPFEATLDEYWK